VGCPTSKFVISHVGLLTQHYQRFAFSLTVVSGFKPHIDQASSTEF